MKVLGMRGLFTRVFDRYKLRRSVLLVQESRQAKDPVTVSASRVPTKRHRQQFEQASCRSNGKLSTRQCTWYLPTDVGTIALGIGTVFETLSVARLVSLLVSRSSYK
jgi:hypothetical protein